MTEIGQLHWNQGEEVAHFAWSGEPCRTYNNHGLSFVYNRKIIRCEEKFVDTKGVIRGRNSQMADRNMIKQQTMVNKLLHRKLKNEQQ